MSIRAIALPRHRFAATLLIASALSGAALANPCTPGREPGAPASAERQPLHRPYVLNGLAATATRQHGGERWLELAVDSPATAARLLGATATPRIERDSRGQVLLACASIGSTVAPLGMAALSQPLW